MDEVGHVNELLWEEVVCDWCGSSSTKLLFEGPDRLLKQPGRFRMVRCQQCGLIRQNPRLTWKSLRHFYPEDYVSYAPLIRDETSRWRRMERRYGMRKRMRAIERFQRGGRLLDVGCGTGIFLEEAQRSKHWEVMGLEPNEKAATYARQALQVPILPGLFHEIALPSDSVDVITLWNVLEHLDHPISSLRHAHRLLRDDGWLVFSIPNVESLDALIFGHYWLGWDLPRHLYLFPRSVLRTVLTATGFRIVAMRCIAASYAALGHSLEFWSQTWNANYDFARRLLLRVYGTLPIQVGLGTPLWILSLLNLSPVITIFAQKAPTPFANELSSQADASE